MKHIRTIYHDETQGTHGELLSSSPMTQAEKQRIKEKALASIPARKKKQKRFLSAAAAILCLFILAACSAELFQWNYRLSAMLNLDEKQQSYAEKNQLVQNIEDIPSVEQNGVTISLRQALADEGVCYLIFDITLPENQVYLADGAPIVDNYTIYGLSSFAEPKTLTLPQDMSAESNTVSMYIAGFFEEDAPNKDIPISVSFENITYRTVSKVVTIEGFWDLSCTVDNKNTEYQYTEVNIPYKIYAPECGTQTGTVISCRITPLTLTLEYIQDNPDDETYDLFYFNPYDDFSLIARYKNGEEIPLYCIDSELNFVYGTRESKHLIICLDHLIDPIGIEEIVYNGITIPIQ